MGLGAFANRLLAPFGYRIIRYEPVHQGISRPVLKACTARTSPLTSEEVEAVMADLLMRTDSRGHPNSHPLSVALRDRTYGLWNTKVLGSVLARQLYDARRAGDGVTLPDAPLRVPLGSRVCRQDDIESPWLWHWCRALRIAPLYHRKVWEDCYVPQALWEAGLLEPGRRALGFAVGTEVMPSFLASRGVDVVATDLFEGDARAEGWRATNQHSVRVSDLWKPDIVAEDAFRRHVTFRPADMNAIPKEFHGEFDICWSICSFEHLGSIEKGLRFVENAARCLRPGGIAVHTTEFNLDETGETIDDWGTVLFQRRHIEDLRQRLEAAGHQMLPVDFSVGSGVMDQFVDVPPFAHQPHPALAYPAAPHLRISVDGFVATSIGIIIRAGSAR
jgi:SAM-dependent methyltransferase